MATGSQFATTLCINDKIEIDYIPLKRFFKMLAMPENIVSRFQLSTLKSI
jgi:hypothetical protein